MIYFALLYADKLFCKMETFFECGANIYMHTLGREETLSYSVKLSMGCLLFYSGSTYFWEFSLSNCDLVNEISVPLLC